jgi:cytochrome c oxidase subunit 1
MDLLTRDRHELARRWMLLAASALAASGLLAFGVVAARVPALARHLTDTEIARRVLVVHVDLGVVVWFAALPVALFNLAAAGAGRAGRLAAVAPWLAATGAVALGSGLIPGWGRPHTVNYVPLVDQPLFVAGLLLFAAGVVASYLDRALLPLAGSAVAPGGDDSGPVAATLCAHRGFLRLGAASTLLALAALAVAYVRLRGAGDVTAAYEQLLWGCGHVLQLATVAFVIVAWALLAAAGTGRPVEGGAAARVSLGLLAVAGLSALALLAAHPAGSRYYSGYAQLMRWGLFPSLVVFLGFVIVPHLGAHRNRQKEAVARALRPLAASAILMLAGLLYGALIRGSDLRIPGHYHATIGSVTLAYMALTLLLLPRDGGRDRDPRRAVFRDRALTRVAILYGTGQLSFSTGLMVAGAFGLGRKTYGVDQLVLGTGQKAGIALMAIGGALALAGGVTWAASLVVRTWRARSPS